MGHLEQIFIAILLETKAIQVPEVNKIKLDQNYNHNNDKWLPGENLSHLPENRHLKVQKHLTEECDAFLESENDIEQIQSLKLKLILLTQHRFVNLIVKHQPSCILK